MAQTGSSKIKQFLLEQQTATYVGTAYEIGNAAGVGRGPASGFMSRLFRAEIAIRTGVSDGCAVYQVDIEKLRSYKTVDAGEFNGGVPGRQSTAAITRWSPRNMRVQDLGAKMTLSEVLLEAAQAAEHLKPLEDYSTKELLVELERRTR